MLWREWNRLGCPLQQNPPTPEQAHQMVMAEFTGQAPAIQNQNSALTTTATTAPTIQTVFTVCYKHGRWELVELSWDGEVFSEVGTVILPECPSGGYYWIEYFNNMFHINESGNATGAVPCQDLMDHEETQQVTPGQQMPLGQAGLPLAPPDPTDVDSRYQQLMYTRFWLST